MQLNKSLLALAVAGLLAVGLASSPADAQACSTATAGAGSAVFGSNSGTIVLPLCPPTNAGSTPGTMDNVDIGDTTPAAGHFTSISGSGTISGPVAATTLSASSTVGLSPASHNVTLAPTGTGTVIINPATASTIDNEAIGGTTPLAGTFTSASAASFKGTGSAPAPTGTGTPTIATGSTNFAGEVTAGSTATSVIITFAGAPLAQAPFCAVSTQTHLAAFDYTISSSAISVTQTATSGNKIDYVCPTH